MAAQEPNDESVLEGLQALGITLVSEWDTLAFVQCHGVSLCAPAQLARLIGYDSAEIAAALRTLNLRGLIERSRVSQGARLYRLSDSIEPSRRSCLMELVSLAQNRPGRLQVIKHLKKRPQPPRRGRASGLRLA